MNLLIDPTCGMPSALASRFKNSTTKVAFHSAPAGERCGRCGVDLHDHHWQVLTPDPDFDDQGGVFNCALQPEETR